MLFSETPPSILKCCPNDMGQSQDSKTDGRLRVAWC